MQYDLIIRNGLCLTPWGEETCSLGIKNGKIETLSASRSDSAPQEINARGLHVLPGLIDPHVHLREPGKDDVETFYTGTKAAALGGITLVFDMPNTAPPITDADVIRWKQEHASTQSWVDFAFYVGATRENSSELAHFEQLDGVCAIKVFAGSSTGSLLVEDDAGIEQVLKSGHRRVAFHAEDNNRLNERRKMFSPGMSYDNHAVWRDEECAFLATRRIMALARKTRRPVHVLHTSTEEELNFLKDYRDVATVEVLANYLTMVAPECYERLGGLAVMNPPIRGKRHFEAAWRAVQDGTVDSLGSDHAPHPLEAKKKPWLEAPSGLPGTQTLVPLMLNHVNGGRLSLARLVDLMAAGPARIYGLQSKGRIAAGYDADFTIVDMNLTRQITNQWIASPIGWTPYDGYTVRGWPKITISQGNIVMREDEMQGEPLGKLALFSP
ncbi:dihydroorotase [Entomobacter blattae]|uniref:Allantoinase n=1 Tax=Entomobacter blattae TaxID=2762277 RepID=A0A7H1NSR8_9PROT|nr:dihydroorotase [Entomobacter blattae]QNT78828.1 Allantoinase [Entomobacter blattae]